MDLGRIHRYLQGRHRQAGGGVLSAPLPALGERPSPCPSCCAPPWGRKGTQYRGAALSLGAHQGTTVVGEMGTGKTFIATAAAHMAGFKRVLVLCPPHLTRKWKREVEETIPHARAAIVSSITDLETAQRFYQGSAPLFVVMSRERAKLSYRWSAGRGAALGQGLGQAGAG